MNLKNFKITHKGLYWGLIVTFALLYLCVGFVSTLHSITFFNLANSMWLATLLGLTYEVGQASVLFSILMSEKNKNKFLPWALMFLLTALQVTANVYASFKFMANSGNNDWQYWQKSILIGVQAANPEMYQVIISWIAGALLPVVALGMTALVAQNMKFISEEDETKPKELSEDEIKVVEEFLEQEHKEAEKLKAEKPELFQNIKMPSREEQLENLKDEVLSNVRPQTKMEENPIIGEGGVEVIKPQFEVNLQDSKHVDAEGVTWEAKPQDLVGSVMSKLPNFKFTPPPPAAPEISPDKLDEIVENEVKRRLQEIENLKAAERNEQDVQDYYQKTLDEDVERLSPVQTETRIVDIKPSVIEIPEENLPEISSEIVNITDSEVLKQAEEAAIKEVTLHTESTEVKPALFKTDSEGKLERVPLTKTRGWHLKKEYLDSNGDVYSFGKYVNPDEPKKA